MQITALGPLAIDGHAVEGSRLPALLLPLLLARGRVVPTGVLVDEVWEDAPPADPLGALQALVTRARRLGLTLTATAGGYRLDPTGLDVDLVTAQDLLAHARASLGAGDPARAADDATCAVALWSADSTTPLDGPAGRLYCDLVALRVEATLASGAHLVPEALDHLRDAVRLLPTDEPLVELLMRGLATTGQEAEALTVYARLCAHLRETYGTDPSALVSRTHLALLRGTLDGPRDPDRSNGPSPRATPPAPLPTTPATPATTAATATAAATPPAPLPSTPAALLRRQTTPLVGRDADVAALERALETSPLVTLVAVGGAGKTRLAAEVAARASRQGVPVHAVELAGVRDPDEVLPALLTVLGAAESTSDGVDPRTRRALDPQERVRRAVGSLRGLLVLDNCEHLLDAAADLAALVLPAADPGLRILATSRAPLGVVGETVHPVAMLSDGAALTLLETRGRAARPGLAWDPETALTVCRRLDNLPLALELAAARLRSMSLADVLAGVDHRFTLLTGALRGLPDRHQGLWAMVDWSWTLLDEGCRTLLRDLAVIPAAFGVDTALAVSGSTDDDATRDGLATLVEQSLLVLDEPGDGEPPRFRMLETVREYGDARLTEDGTREDVMARLTRWAAQRGRTLRDDYAGPGQLAALAATARDHDALAVALRWAVEHGSTADAFAIAADLLTVWTFHGLHLEVLGWARSLLERDDPTARRATWQRLREPIGDATPDTAPDPDDAAVIGALVVVTSGITRDVRLGALGARLARWALTGPADAGRLSHRSAAIATVALALASDRKDRQAVAVDRLVADADPYLHGLGLLLRAMSRENEGDLVGSTEDARTAYAFFESTGDHWGMGISAQALSQWEDGFDAERSDEWLARAIGHFDRMGAVNDARTLLVARDLRRALRGSPEAAAALEATLRMASSAPSERAQAAIGLGALAALSGDADASVRYAELAVGAARSDTTTAPQFRIAVEVGAAVLQIRAGADGEGLLAVAAHAALPLGDMPVIGAVAQGYAELATSRGQTARSDELWELGARLGSNLGLVLGRSTVARPSASIPADPSAPTDPSALAGPSTPAVSGSAGPGAPPGAAAGEGAGTALAPSPGRPTAAEALARLTALIGPD